MGPSSKIKSRLKAIGEFSHDDNIREWEEPAPLAQTIPTTTLTMIDESSGDAVAATERMLDAYDTIQQNAEQILHDVMKVCVGLFHSTYLGDLSEEELANYRDDDGQLSDSLIESAVEISDIAIITDDDDVYIDIHCSCEWDTEHGIPLTMRDDEVVLKI